MAVLDKVKENETLEKAVDWFIKIGTGGFILVGGLLIAQKIFNLTWSISGSIGL